MLSCRDLSIKAPEFLDKQLPWMQTLEIKLHLAMCSNCRCYLKQCSQAFQFLPRQKLGHSSQEVPSHLLSKLLTKLHGDEKN